MRRGRTTTLLVLGVVAACQPVKPPPPPPPPPGPPEVLVVGDSMAIGLTKQLKTYAGYTAVGGAQGACHLGGGNVLGYNQSLLGAGPCAGWKQDWRSLVDAHLPRVVVLNTGGWETPERYLSAQPGPCLPGPWCPPPDGRIDEPAGRQRYFTRLDEAVRLLASRGATVIVTVQPYFDPPRPTPGPPVPAPFQNVHWEPYPPTPPPPGDPDWPPGWRPPTAGQPYVSSKVKVQHVNATIYALRDAYALLGFNAMVLFDMKALLTTTADEFSTEVCPPPGPPDPTACASPVVARGPDGMHLTAGGNQIVGDALDARIRQLLGLA